MGKMKEVTAAIEEAEELKAKYLTGRIGTIKAFNIVTTCQKCGELVKGTIKDGFVCTHCGYACSYDYVHPTEEKMREEKGGKKFDQGKNPWDVVPFECLDELTKILQVGIDKYGKPSGWQHVPDMENRYFAALMRHLSAYRQGERYDQESGELHLSHALCNVVFLLWKELQTKEVAGDKESYWKSLLDSVDTRY